MSLPKTPAERKAIPVATGCIDYFPDAIAAVAELSRIGNDQHLPGQPLHWDRSKSTDEPDSMLRHFIQRGTLDTDGVRHSAKVAWRALAILQKEIEGEALQLKTQFGFTIGEVVNMDRCARGDGPGRVTGFTHDGRVCIQWSRGPNTHSPQMLRHGE